MGPRLVFRAVLALLIGGCTRPTSFDALPTNLAYVAVISAGPPVRASTLRRVTEAGIPILAPAEGEAWVVGWTALQLSEAAPAAGPLQLETEAPTPAGPCDPELPAPAWVARWSQDVLTPDTQTRPPELTARWVASGCAPRRRVLIDVECADRPCVPEGDLDFCEGLVAVPTCGLPTVRVRTTRAGALCFPDGEAGTCVAGTADDERARVAAGAGAVRRCEVGMGAPCRVLWYVAPDAPRIAEVTTAQLPASGALEPLPPTNLQDLAVRDLLRGFAWDVAVSGARVFVSAPEGGRASSGTCDESTRSVLHVLARDTLERLAAVPAPPCLLRLGVDPGGAVVGVFAQDGSWTLGRFDAAGSLQRSVKTDLRVDTRALPVDVVTANPQTIVSVWADAEGRQDTRVLEHGLDLAVARARNVTRARVLRAVSYGEDTVVLATSTFRALSFVTLSGGEPGNASFRRVVDGPDSLIGLLTVGRELWATGVLPARVNVIDGSGTVFAWVDRLGFLDDPPIVPTALAPGRDGTVLMVGARPQSGGIPTTWLGVADAATHTTRAGVVQLGSGLVSRVVSPAPGEAWLLSPWSGELHRILPPEAR